MLKIREIFMMANIHNNHKNGIGRLKRNFLLSVFGMFALTLIFLVYGEGLLVRKTMLINPPKLRQLAKQTERMACILPKLNPFDGSILKYSKAGHRSVQCDKGSHHIFDTDLDTTLIKLKDPKEVGLENCCYRSFTRAGRNKIRFSGDCHPLNQKKTVIPESVEFLAVQCTTSKNNATNIVDMFAFTRLKSDVEDRVSQFKKDMAARKRNGVQVNVILLGLDAISHMNFIRTMPLSHSFLVKNLSAIGMNGYNKVGDNTFPNLVPVLSGLSVSELNARCWPNGKVTFDNCPFIWKNFSRKGYRTAYSEDATSIGTFNYHKSGFLNPPTDYFLQTLTHEQNKKIGHKKLMNTKLCYGPRLGFQVLLNNLQSMANRMGKTRRYFHFTWATSMSHDKLTAPKLGDKDLHATLRWLLESEHLNQTVLVLMSDHGIRYGGIRSTFQGQLEERMPFLYFVLPPWFSRKYGDAVRNLKSNGAKLTSPFDLYPTLLDLLDLSNIEDEEIESRSLELKNKSQTSVPRGISLFLPIPAFRTCALAGINEHWCVCNDTEPVSTGEGIVKESAAVVVQELNRLLSPYPACAQLTLNKTNSARALKTKAAAKAKHSVITVVLSTSPGNAVFEATVKKTGKAKRVVSGDISRINLYGEQSWCVSDYNLKKYCYCLKQL